MAPLLVRLLLGSKFTVDNLKFLHDILGNLQEHANRAGRADAGAVHGDPGRPDARNRLQATAERRDEHTTVSQPGRIGNTRLEFRQLEKVAAVERQPFDLIPRHQTTHLMVIRRISGCVPPTVTRSIISPSSNVTSAVVVVPASTLASRSRRLNPVASTEI